MRSLLIIAVAVVLFAAESRAAELDVTVPESVVRRAPFDVAPEVGRVHAGDKLSGNDQASGAWRFIQLPGGVAGYLRDADVKVVLAPIAPAAPFAASPPTARPEKITGRVNVLELALRATPAHDASVVRMLHENDQLVALPEVKDAWRAVELPDGQNGFVLAAGLKLDEPAPPPSAPVAVAVAAGAPTAGGAAPPAGDVQVQSAQLGVMFETLPTGSLSVSDGGSDLKTDTAFAVAVAPFLDFSLGTPYASLGFSPQIIFGVKGSGGTQSATEYDLRARLTVRDPVSSQATVYARFSPAYSIVSIPDLNPGISNPTGLGIDFAVGAEINVGPKLAFVFDLGYQVGFQATSDAGVNADFGTRYLHVGAGFALGL